MKRSSRRNGPDEAAEAVATATRHSYRQIFGNRPCNGERLAQAVRAAPLFKRIFPDHYVSDEQVEAQMLEILGPKENWAASILGYEPPHPVAFA